MEDILNKLKKGAMQVKDEAEKLTKEAVDKTKKVIDKTKYNYTISEIEGRIKGYLAELGKKLYEEYQNGAEFESDVLEICEKIDELKKEIDGIKEKIADMHDGEICQNCGTIIDTDASFCKKCGNKVD